jgi:methyl-accepting chemotaxis protein
MTQQNAAMVEETNAASHTLAQDAERLGELVGQFRHGQAREATIRAAAPVPVPPLVKAAVAKAGAARSGATMAGAGRAGASAGTASAAGGKPVTLRKPAAAGATARPTPSPAKALMGTLAGAFGNNPGSSPSVAASGEKWEEF